MNKECSVSTGLFFRGISDVVSSCTAFMIDHCTSYSLLYNITPKLSIVFNICHTVNQECRDGSTKWSLSMSHKVVVKMPGKEVSESVAQWLSLYLTCGKPWIQFSACIVISVLS